MKKIIRLTESDIVRIVKRVVNEQMEMPKDKTEDFFNLVAKKSFTKKPTKRYVSNNFISFAWNDPKRPGDNNISFEYNKGEGDYSLALVAKSGSQKCDKINRLVDSLQSKYSFITVKEQYRDTGEICGARLKFSINENENDIINDCVRALHGY
jgi:hypothetical protein